MFCIFISSKSVFFAFRISVLRQREASLLPRLGRCPHLFRHQPPWNSGQRAEKGLYLPSHLFQGRTRCLWWAQPRLLALFEQATLLYFNLTWSADKRLAAFKWIKSLQSRGWFVLSRSRQILWCEVAKLESDCNHWELNPEGSHAALHLPY